MLMFSLPVANWVRLFVWLVIGLVIYFAYGVITAGLGILERSEKAASAVSQD